MPRFSATWIIGLIGAASTAVAEPATRTFTVQNHINHAWTNEMVHYEVSFAPGECWAGGARLTDGAGQAAPVQLTDLTAHPDGSIARANAWFMTSVPPNASVTYTLLGGKKKDRPARYEPDLSLAKEKDSVILATSQIGVRVLVGERRFGVPEAAERIPAPLQGVRLRRGEWTGRGWLETKHLCAGYKAEVTADGPVFKKVAIRYDFTTPEGWGREQSPFYEVTVQVAAGQEVATITETYNLGDPKVYQPPKFKSESDKLTWDWWGGCVREAPDNSCFSFCGAFKPTHARTLGLSVSSPDKGRGGETENEYPLPFARDRFEFAVSPLVGWNPDVSCLYTMYRKEDPQSDIVAVIGAMAGRWRNPDVLPHGVPFIRQATDTTALRIYTSNKPDVVLRAPLNLGHREWLVATLRNPGVVTEARDLTVVGQMSRKYGALPLDKVKDWVLEWPQKKGYPRMFVEPGNLASLRERIRAVPAMEKAVRTINWPVERWLLGDEQSAAEAVRWLYPGAMAPRMQQALQWPVIGERIGYHKFPKDVIDSTLHQGDVTLAWDKMPAETRRDFLRCLAFLEYVLWDPEFLPSREAGFSLGGDDLWANIRAARVFAAALLSDHPMAETWLRDSARYFQAHVEKWFGRDGSPFFTPGYMPAPWGGSLDGFPLVPALLALDRSGVVGDAKDLYPNFHRYARFLVDMMPPKDVRFGQRILPTIGVVGWQGSAIPGEIAALFRKSDPDLAGELLWTWQTSGSSLLTTLSAYWVDVGGITGKPAALHSVSYPGYGAFLRNGAGTDQESYLAVRFGDFTGPPQHNDGGSLLWYARGAPLAMDWGSGHQPDTRDPWWHNTLSYDHQAAAEPVPCPGKGNKGCFYTGKTWYEHKSEPNTALAPIPDPNGDQNAEWSPETHGRIVAFASQPAADYVRGEAKRQWFERKPYCERRDTDTTVPAAPYTRFDTVELKSPFVWTRQLVFVKDKVASGPSYVVIADDLGGNRELDPAFNFWCLAKDVKEVSSRQYAFAGQHGIDLDMHLLEPAGGQVHLGEWGHRQKPSPLAPQGMAEDQKLVRAFGKAGGKGFLVVLCPRKAEEPKPTVELVAEGKMVKVTLPDQTHWILLSKDPLALADGDVKLSGTAGILKRWQDGRAEATLLADGQVDCAGLTLQSKEPATKEK